MTAGKHSQVSFFFLPMYIIIKNVCGGSRVSWKVGDFKSNSLNSASPDTEINYLWLLSLSFLMCKMEVILLK